MSKPAKPITAWAITTGETGMRTQARGLAAAVADIVAEKTVRAGLGSIGRGGDRLEPPWPDVVISCGRRAAASTLAVGKASGGRALMVHVQDPRARADRFDLIVAMDHDAIAPGGHVIKVATALHDLTSENLAEAGQAWSARLAPLGSPLVGVIIGGTLRGRPFTLADSRLLLAGLRRLEGDNPYRGILALADRLVVTSDSVSMVSEALSTTHPVEIFDLGFSRHAAFIQGLIEKGLARRFTGDPSPPPMAGPVNATLQAAEAVRNLLQARTGSAG